jgi:ribosomal protein S12 methylthiotransferase accessory factor
MDRKAALMRDSANFRHGIVLPPQEVASTPADIPGIVNIGVPQASADAWKSASGGVGRDRLSAELAAIGEALERYAAAACAVPRKRKAELPRAAVLDVDDFTLFSPAQIRDPAFPHAALHGGERLYTNVFSLQDNAEVWAPVELVGLTAEHVAAVSTSSGLACAPSPYLALLRGLQEIIERDALMVTWLHAIPGGQRPLDVGYRAPVEERGGLAICIDATPAYSVFPVAIVTGSLPLRGHPRISLGAACRATWDEAVEKAYLEWVQGIVFAGQYYAYHPSVRYGTYRDVKTFDDHAVYYTVHPQEWQKVALIRGQQATHGPPSARGQTTAQLLAEALAQLRAHQVRIYYRDLTTPDLRQMGLAVMRVLSPDLTPIHCDQAFPFLGGKTADVLWRYPWAEHQQLTFPNPLPHPLG